MLPLSVTDELVNVSFVRYALNLCNAIGSPVDCKYIDVEPTFLTVTPYHVVAASHSFVYVWQYRTLMSKLTSVDLGAGSLRRREGRERCFHIDDVPDVQSAEALTPVAGREPSAEPIRSRSLFQRVNSRCAASI